MMYAAIGLVALCAGILQGVTGFGAGIVTMMVLPSLFPLNQAVMKKVFGVFLILLISGIMNIL